MPVVEKDLDIVKGAFTVGKPRTALKNIKCGKAFGVDNIPGILEDWWLQWFSTTTM